MKSNALSLLAVLALSCANAWAGPVAGGFDQITLGACDDCSSDATALGFTADFYGGVFTQAYVGSNGYLTFVSPQTAYTPTALSSDYVGNSIVAPFFADVNTTVAGTIAYGAGTYAGRNAFGATYSDVAYFGGSGDKTNTFQVILVDRSDVKAGNFDIYLNYDKVQWETGDASGGTGGLGGASAVAGYANGSGVEGTFAQLPGSLAPGSFVDGGSNALSAGTNDGVAGQYLFEIRDGIVAPPLPLPPPPAVPEPASGPMLLLGCLLLWPLLRRRSGQAKR